GVSLAPTQGKPFTTGADLNSRADKILWASRLHAGKRPDILLKIARRLPHVTFEVWGKPDIDDALMQQLEKQPNIFVRGEYSRFSDIPKEGISSFLYTTESDGLPIVLMEAASSGLPLIAPDVGGISELVGTDTGWLIPSFEDVDAYIAAASTVL